MDISSLSFRDTIQYTARINTSLLLPPNPDGMPAAPPESCIIPAVPGQSDSKELKFSASAMNRLHSRHEWLNDDCIDLGAQLLQRHFGLRMNSAIFSVFTITQYLRGHDEALWRTSLLTPRFWERTIWMIPINRDHCHWTLAIVYWKKRRIAYFDSFASSSAWEEDAPVAYDIYRIDEHSDPIL